LATFQTLATELRAVRAESDQQLGTARAAVTTSEAAIEQLASAVHDGRSFLQALSDDVAALRGRVGADEETWTAEGGVVAVVQRVHGLRRDLDESSVRASQALDRLARAEAILAAARASIARERARVDLLLHDVRRPDAPGVVSPEVAARLAAGRSSLVYTQLEDRFRGSSEDLTGRFERGYGPELEQLATDGGPAADIGCGAGEWLAVLARRGVTAWGVDLSPDAVERARARGVDARVDDGIKALAAAEPGTLAAVTAFQVIEHLAFDDLVTLVEAAFVALRPGGVLILETPNPINLAVASYTFYLDPSHVRPVPPELADFVLDTVGFVDVETRFLNEALAPSLPDLGAEASPVATALVERINARFFGPPDYAVIGRKPAG
jgi:O-antigen chain-terminating methyltransferase